MIISAFRKEIFAMDEFEKINNEKPTENGDSAFFNYEKSDESADSNSSEMKFSADGTYHGKPQQTSETDYGTVFSQNTEKTDYQQTEKAEYQNPLQGNPYAGNVYNSYNRPGANVPPVGNYGQFAQNPSVNTQYYGNAPYANNINTQKKPEYAYPADGGSENKKKSKGGKIFAIIAGVLVAFVAVALVLVVIFDMNGGSDVTEDPTFSGNYEDEIETNASPETDDTASSEGEMSPKAIFKQVAPSSVGILVYDRSNRLSSEGTGVFLKESDDGKGTYIVTCAHVISEDAEFVRIQTYSGEEYDATIVGFDARTDIGVLRVNQTGFSLAEVGDSSKTFVGDPIYAIGNPGGVEFANSFTDGMVSALDRPVNSSSTGYTMDCIQHTAAINPGNSGGALVNAFGQVIGINSMKIVASDYEGMGFAVPSSVFVKIVNEIIANGYVANRPKLGITYVPASEYENYGMFVALKDLPSGSIVIYEIASDSAFNGTDVEAGDMITAVNGNPLDDASYLSEYIEDSDVGDTLTLSIVRINNDYSYEEFTVSVTLVEDRGDTFITEDSTEDNNGSIPPEEYEDYFKNYFDDYFSDYFGDDFPF